MQLTLEMELPLNARLLPRTRQAVAGYLEELLPSKDEVHDVILALDEACANVIRHAFPDESGGGYAVTATIDDSEVRIIVEDHGVGLDPARLDEDWVAPEALSGRGLSIIQSVMSSVDVCQPEAASGTRLVMRKQLQ